ncbi:MAG: TetR/AcrR family transcriptional regulator [Caldilineaceae bacterium]
MARIFKEQEYIEKRNEILDATQQLIYSKGYERMTIGDILTELKISSGAFYHYFDSKPAVLDAFIARIQEEGEKPLLPLIEDAQLSALEKLQGFFTTLDRLRMAQKRSVAQLVKVWYHDDNAIVRQKVDDAVIKQRAPLLTAIVRQGIQEGVFTTAYPEQAGEIILALQHGMSNTHAQLLLTLLETPSKVECVDAIVATHAAYMDAIERVLGASPNSLLRTDAEAVKIWAMTLQAEGKA